MELLTLHEPELVVAIDIGSTYSGYAWQWRSDFLNNRSNLEFNTNWGGGAIQLHKTKTCILLDEEMKINSFGNLAEQRFCKESEKDPNGLIGKWFFFKRFKLLLYANKFDCDCEDEIGQHVPFREVMTKFIQALREHFLKKIEEKNQTLNEKKTLWVITVPQIWSEGARKFMRSCAEKSGINPKNLLLALEPEAAAITCIHLPEQQRQAMNSLGHVGDQFITADLGGGTADIAAIEILPEGFIKEIFPGQGNLVGGQDVNNAFFQACTDLFDRNVWRELFNENNTDELRKLEDDFENSKVSIGNATEEDQYISLEIPLNMQRKLIDGAISIKESAKDSKYFKSERGKFMFDPKYVREILFDETVKRVLDVIGRTLREVSGVKKVVLVGGFAESAIVVQNIRKGLLREFPEVQIYVPTSPFRAVLYGAVLYGHDPFIFKSRISRETYGVGTNEPFDEKIHDKKKRWTNKSDGKDYCKDIFSVHVRKDQSVMLKQKQPSLTYCPMYIGQTKATFPIVASTSKSPKYTTDANCTQRGEVTVDIPDTTGEQSRKVLVTMVYGGTELAVTATDVATGKEFEANIRFDNAYYNTSNTFLQPVVES